jgi:myosin VIIa
MFTKNPEMNQLNSHSKSMTVLMANPLADRPYTLERFANDNFRVVKRSVSLSGGRRLIEMWRHSREPIQAPLLKKIEGKDEPSAEAVKSYLAIMMYMGDLPLKRPKLAVELVDQIFRAPLKYVC